MVGWLVDLFYGVSTLFGLFNLNHLIKFQTIQFSISIVLVYKQFS